MKELIEQIAMKLVDYPEQVSVTEVENENSTVLELRVAKSDLGKVIGKEGRIAKAMRVLLGAATSHAQKKYTLEIVED
jgi:predicted RNA-binding protein YlqC (UPF0109 family)